MRGKVYSGRAVFPTGRIRYMMEEADVDFILTEREYAEKLDGFSTRLTDCEICGLEAPAAGRDAVCKPDRPAYVAVYLWHDRTPQRGLRDQPQCLPLCAGLCG